MKKIQKLIPILSIMLMLSGCYDLDRYPQDQLSSGTFWQNDEDAKQGVLACYAALKQNYTFGVIFGMDCVSDICTGYDEMGHWDISRSVWTNTSSYPTARWQQSYEGIRRSNTAIQFILGSSTISDDTKKVTVAEAKFLRALLYFHLLNHFGSVPIYDETVNYNSDYMNLTYPRSSEEKVRALILSDLEAAINNLPVNWTTSDYGRATKGAAYALRGKVYLYNKQYDLAIKDFNEIVLDPSGKGYGYSLYPNYADLFTQKGDESKEMIFAIQNYTAVGFNYGMPFAHYIGNNTTFGFGWNSAMPSVDLVDSYELKDGHPFNWNDFIPDYKEKVEVRKNTFMSTLTSDYSKVAAYPKYYNELLAMYEKRDPRMKQTIILPYSHYLGYVGTDKKDCEFVYAKGVSTANGFVVVNKYGNENTPLYLFRKFVPEGNMDGQLVAKADRDHVPVNFPLIRYADVLLMLAECYNEQGNVDEAVKYINMVRARTSTNMPAINNGQPWMEARTKSKVLERIMHERAVEFPLEGFRYYDLKRWNVIKAVQNSPELDIFGNVVYTNKFEDRDLLWPIPSVEMDLNPNLTQNPGW